MEVGLAPPLMVYVKGWNCVRASLSPGEAERRVRLPRPPAKESAVHELTREAVEARFIRNRTPEGNMRVLMTSLLDAQRHACGEFGHLYLRRWRVEEAFKRIKHRLCLDRFLGLSHLAEQQDFAARVLCDNLAALASSNARSASQLPAHSRINRVYARTALKQLIAALLLGLASAGMRKESLKLIASRTCKHRPGLSKPRSPRPKPHPALSLKAC